MTVVVVNPLDIKKIEFNEKDFKIEWYSGTGCGGQFRNKHQNSCRLIHLSSGMIITAQSRSRENSLKEAKTEAIRRLNEHHKSSALADRSGIRKAQAGSGMRGDKIRTYREQDGIVIDHRSDKKINLKKVEAGQIDLCW